MQPWVHPDDYYAVRFAMYEAIKIAFDEAGIGIPYPQQVVHLQRRE
jgi:small conductance mechanosensitive channel